MFGWRKKIARLETKVLLLEENRVYWQTLAIDVNKENVKLMELVQSLEAENDYLRKQTGREVVGTIVMEGEDE